MKKNISILLVDDHPMMREGTRRLLEEDPGFSVVGEAGDGAQALALCQQYMPDVVILDISMKGMNGFSVARLMLAHEKPPAILVLTAYEQSTYIQTMLKLGVKGYWLKSARSSDIRQAVLDVADNKRTLDPEVREVLEEYEGHALIPVERLTNRELAVLRLIIQGTRNNEIAQRLTISVKTVEAYLTSLYGKLGVQSRAEVIALAQKQGLLLEDEPNIAT